MKRVAGFIAVFILGLAAGVVLARLFPSTPPVPAAQIVQPPTGGPNAALLWWRYGEMIDEALERGVGEESEAAAPSPDRASLLVEHQPAIEGMLRAGAVANCDFNIEYDVGMERLEMPHLGRARSIARVLAMDARRLLAEGDVAGATDRIVALVQLSRHLRSDRTLIGALVVTAIATLACDEIDRIGALDAEQRMRLSKALAFVEEEDPLGFRSALAGEKRIALASEVFETGGAAGFLFRASADEVASIFDEAIEAWDAEDAGARLGALEARADGMAGMFVPSLVRAKQAEEMAVGRLAEVRGRLEE